jgi:hypothetical protein
MRHCNGRNIVERIVKLRASRHAIVGLPLVVRQCIHNFCAIQSTLFHGGDQQMHSVIGVCGVRIWVRIELGTISFLELYPIGSRFGLD